MFIGVWAALIAPMPFAAVVPAVLGWQLLLIAMVDAEHFWLADGLTLPLIVGLGEGDSILLAGAGAWVGWIGLASVLLWACLVGGSVIVARMAAGRLVKSTDRLPFGSYLSVGIWLTWIFGPLGL